MSETLGKNIDKVKQKFLYLSSEERYTALIQFGRELPPLPSNLKTPDLIVPGCQSILHLHSEMRDGKIFFQASSDALISAGLAALLINVYNGESPETILTSPPTFLKELQIEGSLSPSRSNGLYQIHLRMKQQALKYLAHTQ